MLVDYGQYFQKFQIFAQGQVLGNEYVKSCDKAWNFSKAIKLLRYNSVNIHSKRIVLIVPSIFNSPEILFINKSKNFTQYLQEIATIYLIEWQEINSPKYNLNNYIFEIIKVIKYLAYKSKCKIDLIGHCIGGTISLIAANLNSKLLNSITLLNTPWDFSYLKGQRIIHRQLKLDEAINHLNLIPPIYQQILFFLINPKYFEKKITKFFEIMDKNQSEVELFFKIEHWLLSGHSLSKATYLQLTEQVIDQNILYHNKLMINDKRVSNLKLELPVCIVTAEKDTIAPLASTLPLLKIIKNSKLIEVQNGHINYLISTKLNNFFEKFEVWFLTCK